MTLDALSLLLVVGHTLVIYLFLIVALTHLNRRQIAQLTMIDLLILAILGSAVETAMVAGNTTLPAGLVSAATLLGANRLLAAGASRWRSVRRLVIGGPILVVHEGHVVHAHLDRVGLTEDDILAALRARGFAGVDDVREAILEMDGSVSVIESRG